MSCENCKIKSSNSAQAVTIVYCQQNNRLWATIIALTVSVVIMACCMMWVVANSQRITTEAVTRAMKETISTNEHYTNVTQDVADGNAIIQSGENATYEQNKSR